jgi:hypothetical protein
MSKKAATAGAETTKIDIPVTHRDVFYNLPIKIMWPFKNAIALNNTTCMLFDPQVNHPIPDGGIRASGRAGA